MILVVLQSIRSYTWNVKAMLPNSYNYLTTNYKYRVPWHGSNTYLSELDTSNHVD